jgi:hypothetical protein
MAMAGATFIIVEHFLNYKKFFTKSNTYIYYSVLMCGKKEVFSTNEVSVSNP